MNTTLTRPGMLSRYLPILNWGPEYSRRTLVNDLIVAGIVTVMLIPQSLAYALLAGLPAQTLPLTAASILSHRAGKDVTGAAP